MKRSHHNRLVMGAAAVLAAASVVAIAPWSSASHAGLNGPLTASNGSSVITFSGGGEFPVGTNVAQAQWSPDGSRALFVSDADEILTVRFDDGGNIWPFTSEAPAGVSRAHPTWLGDRYGVIWAQQAAPNDQWHLRFQSSALLPDPFNFPVTPTNDNFNYTHPDAGPGSLVVLQRQAETNGVGTGTPEVYRLDPGLDPDLALVVTNGSNPAVSPDGTQVAFVRNDGSNNEIFVVPLGGGTAVQVTQEASNKDNPTWSPDGATLAFSVGSSVFTVPSDAVLTPTITSVPGLLGAPAYRSERVNDVVRLAGANRFATAAAVSQAFWLDGEAQSVVLSRSDLFADALGGAALAAAKEGPLLLTPPTTLNATTEAEMVRVLGTSNPASKTVYLLGGTGAISQGVQDQIDGLGYATVRLAGASRFTTAIAIANAIDPTPDLILAATGLNFPDALAAGAAAGSFDVPPVTPDSLSAVVILTANTVVPPDVEDYLNDNPTAALYGIGGAAATAVAPFGPEDVLVGVNRYETALFVAEVFFAGEISAGVATGADWPDALAGGALMATINGPLLLTPGTSAALHPATAFLLDVTCGSIDTGLIFGGTGVVNTVQAGEVGIWISGPVGFDTFPAALARSRAAGLAAAAGSSAGVRPRLAQRTSEQIKAAAESPAGPKDRYKN